MRGNGSIVPRDDSTDGYILVAGARETTSAMTELEKVPSSCVAVA
jgi:hypothetical protein